MKKQILKGFTMLALIVGIAFVSAVVSANGQSNRMIRANVPFAFTVGDKALPAGEYTASSITQSNAAVVIRSSDSKDAAVRLSNAVKAGDSESQAKLVFHRYGQRYFLSEVWLGDTTGHQLLKSKQERSIIRELAANHATNDSAKNDYQVVEIVASLR
jgi:hypothetical protein